METLLSIQNVSHSFHSGFWLKKKTILNNITFDIPRGSVVGLLGENGAGKTTLIYLIVGVRKPSLGTIDLASAPDSRQPTHSTLAKQRLGYLPERPYFPEHLTGEQFLEYFGTLAGLSKSDIRKRVPITLSLVGMESARKTELKNYSKGMLQRIGIAQALLHEPDLLVLDEPMSGLDPQGRKEMRELIQNLSKEGKTILFSSHIISDVEAICNQVAVIRKGSLIAHGPIGTFLSSGPIKTEIAFTGLTTEKAKLLLSLEIEKIPDGARTFLPSQQEVNTALEKLIQSQATILWVNPVRPSLEDLFMSRRELL